MYSPAKQSRNLRCGNKIRDHPVAGYHFGYVNGIREWGCFRAPEAGSRHPPRPVNKRLSACHNGRYGDDDASRPELTGHVPGYAFSYHFVGIYPPLYPL